MDVTAIPSHVQAVNNCAVTVRASTPAARDTLAAMGFTPTGESPELLQRSATTDTERAQVFEQLRVAGFAWARGREWSPAEVFEPLRDLHLLSGPFKPLAWISPTEWVLRDD